MVDTPFNDTSYERFLNENKLMGSKCTQCGAVYAPPRPVCIKCRSESMEWMEMSGKGKLSAFTCIAVGPPSMCDEGYDRNNPYCSGVIELEEGAKVVARINGMNTKMPESINIGTPLRVEFLHRGEGDRVETILAFEPL
ncbi:MAG: Zn-ribbon domain-containing OB-fold protein [Planctomycetes bacterium]|nr:Zn-ribbon domain-containing OB-fold protein [Planctomycetota bacterium]